MKSFTKKTQQLVNKYKRKSLAWKGYVFTIIGAIIAFGTWLLPNPFSTDLVPTPEPTSIVESLGISEPIPKRKPGSVRILVAKFDEANQSSYKVTDLILANLRSALGGYSDTQVIATDRILTEKDGSDTAIKIGEVYDASIVIWGWYGLTDTTVPLAIHFEIIEKSETFRPNSCGVVTAKSISQVRKIDPLKLSNLTLQTNLSDELSYVTLFTLGLARYDAEDWLGAVGMFDDAISYLSEETIISANTEGEGILVDQNLLFYYRGRAQLKTENYSTALADFQKLPNPNATILLGIASAFAGKGNTEQAIETYSLIIEKERSPLTSIAAFNRGMLYEETGKLTLAKQDFSLAIREDQENILEISTADKPQEQMIENINEKILSNPQNPFYYYWRGIKYQKAEQYDQALDDFDHAIELVPYFYVARDARSRVYLRKKNYKATIDELNYVFQLDYFYTPCNLQNRGVSYMRLNEFENSEKDFLEVISLTTQAIEEDHQNTHAYYVRRLAYQAITKDETFLQRITPFQSPPYYALKDGLMVRKLNEEFAMKTGIGDAKSLVTHIWIFVAPYLIWGGIIYLIIICRKSIETFLRKYISQLINIK